MLINKYKKLLTGTCISSEHLISLLGEHPCIKGKSAEYLSPGVFFLLKALQAGAELGQAQLKLGLDFSEDLVTLELIC